MTNQQRKGLLIVLAVVLGSYFVRAVVGTVMQMAYYRQQQIFRQQQMIRQQQAIRAAQERAKAKPVLPQPPSNAPKVAESAPTSGVIALSPLHWLSGTWHGRTAVEGRGICDLKLEFSEGEPFHFSGFSTFTCTNAAALMSPKDRNDQRARLINQLNPDSAILSGTAENGEIFFHVTKSIGTDIDGCSVTSFTLTPFGGKQLAAQWQGTCHGGHAILQRART